MLGRNHHWKRLSNSERRLVVFYLHYQVNRNWLRPLIISTVIYMILPDHIIAIPTAIGLAACLEVFLRAFHLDLVKIWEGR